MASGFFAILDDISALMDDVASSAKIATQKTSGILGDDLAVNAEKSTGFVSSRELPVLWAITKGSFINKLIIVPVALLLNAFFPIAIKVILVLGGFFLAFEGVEKILHYFFHSANHNQQENNAEKTHDKEAEKAKIKSAITTDFILSVEIVIIALSTVLDKSLSIQIATTAVVAILATIGVYGIVAIIVRLDDFGFLIVKNSGTNKTMKAIGLLFIHALPIIIKILTVLGTIALLLVSGGIFEHNLSFLHHFLPHLPSLVLELLLGITGGLLTVGLVFLSQKIISSVKKNKFQ